MLKKSVSIFLAFLFTISPFQPLLAMDAGRTASREDDHDRDYVNLDHVEDNGSISNLSNRNGDEIIRIEDSSESESSESENVIFIETSEGKYISYKSFLESNYPHSKKGLLFLYTLFELVHRGLQLGVLGLRGVFFIAGVPFTPKQAYYGLKMLGTVLVVPAGALYLFSDLLEGASLNFGFKNATFFGSLIGTQDSRLDINVGGSVGVESLPELPPVSLPNVPPTSFPIPFLPPPAQVPVVAPQGADGLTQGFNFNLPIAFYHMIDMAFSPFNKTEYGVNIIPEEISELFGEINSASAEFMAFIAAWLCLERLFILSVQSKYRPHFLEEYLANVLKKISEVCKHHKEKIFPHHKDKRKHKTLGAILRNPFAMTSYHAARLLGFGFMGLGYAGGELNDWRLPSYQLDFSTQSSTTNLSAAVFNESASVDFPLGSVYANASGHAYSAADAQFQFAIFLYLLLENLHNINHTQLMLIGGAMLVAYGITGEIFARVVR